MSSLVKEFNDYRTRMNEVILSKNNLVMKRLGTLTLTPTKKVPWRQRRKKCLDWLSANRWMLRCDDCIKYHLGKCHDLGITTAQVYEIFAVANIVGGTIVIPHTRRAAEYREELADLN